MKISLSLIATAVLLTSCGNANYTNKKQVENKVPADPATYGNTITSDELKTLLYTYASDEFEGRETGEPGQKKAVNYLKEHYQNMKIASPLGGDDYFQEVPLERQKIPNVQMTINGKEAKMFEDFLSTGSAATQVFNTNEIVYAGYGIETKNYSDYTDLNVAGKLVLVKAGEPKNPDGTYITTGGTEITTWSEGRRARSAKKEVAQRKGAKGLLIMDNKAFDYYTKIYKNYQETNWTGKIELVDPNGELLSFLINDTFAKTLLKDIITNDIPKIINTTVELSIEKNAESLSSENVVAFIKGTEKPDEVLVISAHLDHEGIKDGEVYNGADDDGSGTVAILEIAEAFKTAVNDGYSPKRSILFLHVTAEEKGLLGSRHYTDNDPIFPLENTIANLNIDMIGRVDKFHTEDRNYVYAIGSDMLSQELHDINERANNTYTSINLDYRFSNENDPNRYYYRSDHYNFAKNNVPVIFYFNGSHEDYHRPTDTPDKIEYDLLETRTRLIFYTAWEIANRNTRPILNTVETSKP